MASQRAAIYGVHYQGGVVGLSFQLQVRPDGTTVIEGEETPYDALAVSGAPCFSVHCDDGAYIARCDNENGLVVNGLVLAKGETTQLFNGTTLNWNTCEATFITNYDFFESTKAQNNATTTSEPSGTELNSAIVAYEDPGFSRVRYFRYLADAMQARNLSTQPQHEAKQLERWVNMITNNKGRRDVIHSSYTSLEELQTQNLSDLFSNLRLIEWHESSRERFLEEWRRLKGVITSRTTTSSGRGTYQYRQSCDGQLIPVGRHLSTVIIYVYAPEGRSPLEVELSDLVGELSLLLATTACSAQRKLIFSHRGQLLDDDCTLESYNIQHGSVLNAVMRTEAHAFASKPLDDAAEPPSKRTRAEPDALQSVPPLSSGEPRTPNTADEPTSYEIVDAPSDAHDRIFVNETTLQELGRRGLAEGDVVLIRGDDHHEQYCFLASNENCGADAAALSKTLQTNLRLGTGDCITFEAPPLDDYGQPLIKQSTRVEIELLDDTPSSSISAHYAHSFFNKNRLLCEGSVFVSEPAGLPPLRFRVVDVGHTDHCIAGPGTQILGPFDEPGPPSAIAEAPSSYDPYPWSQSAKDASTHAKTINIVKRSAEGWTASGLERFGWHVTKSGVKPPKDWPSYTELAGLEIREGESHKNRITSVKNLRLYLGGILELARAGRGYMTESGRQVQSVQEKITLDVFPWSNNVESIYIQVKDHPFNSGDDSNCKRFIQSLDQERLQAIGFRFCGSSLTVPLNWPSYYDICGKDLTHYDRIGTRGAFLKYLELIRKLGPDDAYITESERRELGYRGSALDRALALTRGNPPRPLYGLPQLSTYKADVEAWLETNREVRCTSENGLDGLARSFQTCLPGTPIPVAKRHVRQTLHQNQMRGTTVNSTYRGVAPVGRTATVASYAEQQRAERSRLREEVLSRALARGVSLLSAKEVDLETEFLLHFLDLGNCRGFDVYGRESPDGRLSGLTLADILNMSTDNEGNQYISPVNGGGSASVYVGTTGAITQYARVWETVAFLRGSNRRWRLVHGPERNARVYLPCLDDYVGFPNATEGQKFSKDELHRLGARVLILAEDDVMPNIHALEASLQGKIEHLGAPYKLHHTVGAGTGGFRHGDIVFGQGWLFITYFFSLDALVVDGIVKIQMEGQWSD